MKVRVGWGLNAVVMHQGQGSDLYTACRCNCVTGVLDFDHIDPRTKLANVSDMVRRGCTLQTVVEEIRKCRVLWSPCHREHTAEQFP